MKVTVKDFQRLKGENVFEFPEGVTIIQGRSGSGKTTVFYAIDDCLSNPKGVSDVINWGAKQAEVSIENVGNSLKWIKTASSCEYVDKEGKPYNKASKIDSRDIADLGFYFDKKDNVMNIHGEWGTLFPFGASETEMFKMFEDIFNISSSFQIIEDIKADEKAYKAEIANLSTQINDLTIRNNNIDDVVAKANPNVDYYINDLQEKSQKLNLLSHDYSVLSSVQGYLNVQIPAEFDASIVYNNANYYDQLRRDYETYCLNSKRAMINVPVEETFDLGENPYLADYNLYKQTLGMLQQYEQYLSTLDTEEAKVMEKRSQIKVCPTCGKPL